MFGNRTESGRNNIAGIAIYNRRKALGISQREVADRLRSHGLVIDKNAVQRMESGERFIIDTELHAIAKVFGISINELLEETDLDSIFNIPNRRIISEMRLFLYAV